MRSTGCGPVSFASAPLTAYRPSGCQASSGPYIALNEGVDDEITAVLEANGIQPDTRFIESDDHAVVAMAEQRLGTSLMSMMMIQGFSRQISAVPLDPPAWRDLGVGFRDRKSLSGAAAAFLQYTRQWLTENEYCEKECSK